VTGKQLKAMSGAVAVLATGFAKDSLLLTFCSCCAIRLCVRS